MSMQELLDLALRIDEARQRSEREPEEWSEAEHWANNVIGMLAMGERIEP